MDRAVQQALLENTPLTDGEARTPAGWAFEFLRRNPKFISAVDSREERTLPSRGGGGVAVVAAGAGESTAGFGVLYCDRCDRPIDNAIVFWARDLSVDIIDARIVNSPADETEDNVLKLEKFKCDKILLTGLGRTPQLLLKAGSKQIQINCIGGDLASGGQAIIPQIAPDRNIERQLLAMRRLFHLYSEREFAETLFKPDTKSARLGEVLTALDLWLRQTPMRGIAVALYGEHIVNDDWAPEGGYLIDRVRRSIRRGRFMMEKGYRQLLA
ncbi:DNA -binding domain-containing protein [Hyphococcus sp.]|uniref:DNA -binding domain-containing protein n=1 Tax=Hyphococcus sp. TaxID=2038636 RepID=UPI0035C6CC16